MKLIFDGPKFIKGNSGRKFVDVRFDYEDGTEPEQTELALYGAAVKSANEWRWHLSIGLDGMRKRVNNLPITPWMLDAIQEKLRELNGEAKPEPGTGEVEWADTAMLNGYPLHEGSRLYNTFFKEFGLFCGANPDRTVFSVVRQRDSVHALWLSGQCLPVGEFVEIKAE